jgi:hypothetical protein
MTPGLAHHQEYLRSPEWRALRARGAGARRLYYRRRQRASSRWSALCRDEKGPVPDSRSHLPANGASRAATVGGRSCPAAPVMAD